MSVEQPPLWRVHPEEPRLVVDQDGEVLGMMDTPGLARRAVDAVNAVGAEQAARIGDLTELVRLLRDRPAMSPSDRVAFLGEDLDQAVQPEAGMRAQARASVCRQLVDVTGLRAARQYAVELGIPVEAAVALVSRLAEHLAARQTPPPDASRCENAGPGAGVAPPAHGGAAEGRRGRA